MQGASEKREMEEREAEKREDIEGARILLKVRDESDGVLHLYADREGGRQSWW